MSEHMTEHVESVDYRGRIFEIVSTEQPDGRIFEKARRAPGVRLIVEDKAQKKLLLTREYRAELGGWDYRLPGGKVFDTLEEYEAHRASGADILDAAIDKAKAEGLEEAGLHIDSLKHIKTSKLGATVEWDLYIFEATQWSFADGQALEAGEEIEADSWLGYDEVEKMILEGQMQEERVALVLFQWLRDRRNDEV